MNNQENLLYQCTIVYPISCYGIGVHSGDAVQLTLKPAKENTGIIFIRTDINAGDNVITALYSNVTDTRLSTAIGDNHNRISTIEHLMAALWACKIDNVIVEIDGPEVPIMDGSSKPFIWMIECSGTKIQNAPKKYLKILKPVKLFDNNCELTVEPAEKKSIDLTIDFASKAIGKQNLQLTEANCFKEEIASARTFGFVHELEYLKKQGLARGASLDNAIGIEQDVILNSELRYKDEFVRHKLLDLVGDLGTASGQIIGSFHGYKTSHALNNQFLRKLFADSSNYTWLSHKEL